jgi:hypothetical protein
MTKQPWIEPAITELAAPFALLTGDPLFDPRQPVKVNGYLYLPVKQLTNQGGTHEVAQEHPSKAGTSPGSESGSGDYLGDETR